MGDLNPKWRYLTFSEVSEGSLSLRWEEDGDGHVVDSRRPALKVVRDLAVSHLALVVGGVMYFVIRAV